MQRTLQVIGTLSLIAVVFLLVHIVAVVLPELVANQTHLSVMQECSQRRLAALAEIKAGAEQVMKDVSEEEQKKIKQSLTDTFGTFNSAEFYQKCAETVKADWSL